MKVFLDTNVLVASVGTRGLCADVLREVLTSHQLVVSDPLIDELKRALKQKLRIPQDLIAEFIGILAQDAIISSPTDLVEVKIKDRDDAVILSSAINGDADIFVTGDRELLELRRVHHLHIVSPRVFWETLKSQSSK